MQLKIWFWLRMAPSWIDNSLSSYNLSILNGENSFRKDSSLSLAPYQILVIPELSCRKRTTTGKRRAQLSVGLQKQNSENRPHSKHFTALPCNNKIWGTSLWRATGIFSCNLAALSQFLHSPIFITTFARLQPVTNNNAVHPSLPSLSLSHSAFASPISLGALRVVARKFFSEILL